MYTELFTLCGYEPEEIEKETPRIERAFEKAKLGREDIERAETRLREYFDTTSFGVRKSLKIWMEQFIDMVLAKEEGKKIIYPSYPTVPDITLAINMASEDVFCQTPELVLDMVMGQIFGKIDPILEAAEAHGLSQGLAMCSLNQARVGGIIQEIAPMPDLLLGTGFFCDQTPKTDDYLHEVYGIPMVIMDGCMDSSWDEFPEISSRRVKALGIEIRRAMEECQDALGIKITDELLEESFSDFTKLWTSLFMLWDYMKNDPQPMSLVDLGPLWWMATSPDRRALTEGIQVIAQLIREMHQKVKQGKGVVPKGAPKALILCHQATDPRVMRMIEDAGIAVPTTALIGVTASQAAAFADTKYTIWEEKVANNMLSHGLYHSTPGCIHRYRELCQTWNVDGVLNFYHFSCRAYCIAPLMIKSAIEEDVGIPVLSLEGDFYDTRQYSAESLKTRVETFADMLTIKAASRSG